MPLFDAAFLHTLELVRVATSQRTPGLGRGHRRGAARGRGLEFADYRPYAQGDDSRHVDWAVYQRLNRLVLRLYDEERGLPVHVLLDRSRSMASHDKFDQARRIAAALCYIGLADLDRVTLAPFDDHLGNPAAGTRTVGSVVPLFESLEGLSADGRTDLGRMVIEFGRRSAPVGVVILISDFLDARFDEAVARLASMGHEVFAIHVYSDREIGVDAWLGEMTFVDAETGAARRVSVTPRLLAEYQQAWAARGRAIASACAHTRAHYIPVRVEQPFDQIILHTLRGGRLLA